MQESLRDLAHRSRGEEALGRTKLGMAETSEEVPCQTITEHRILWDSLEFKALDRVLRQNREQRSERVHMRRWLAELDRDD